MCKYDIYRYDSWYENLVIPNFYDSILPNNDNNVMMYRRLISLIEEYNRMAKDKGLPTKKVPIYVNNMNCSMIA